MKGVVFSEAARKDRRAITLHTVDRFGIGQSRKLRQTMEMTLTRLVEFPLSGHTNAELDPPGHSFRYAVVSRAFVIVYQPAENGDGIRVARILHGAMDIAAELDRDGGEG